MVIKEYSTAWLKEEIRIAQEAVEANPHLAATLLLNDLKRYVEHLGKNALKRGSGTSKIKAATSAANGAKGGRPKGSKNKKKILYDPVTKEILLSTLEKTEKHKNFTNEDLQEFIKKGQK